MSEKQENGSQIPNDSSQTKSGFPHELRAFYENLVNEYSLRLLHWAYRKTGNRERALELSQEVWLQVFSAVSDSFSQGVPIAAPEHFLWKVARFVWLKTIQKNTAYQRFFPMDLSLEGDYPAEGDFVQEMLDGEEKQRLLNFVRKKLMGLDRLQREIMISFYLDGKSIKEIASGLAMKESAVKWHLYNTRKRLKEESDMIKETDFVYRPLRLTMALCGERTEKIDTVRIEDSLVKQNICIACYRVPQTLDMLNHSLGIPKAYLESDVEWLLEKEFLTKTPKGYLTTFRIQNSDEIQDEYEIYLKHKEKLSDVLVEGLLAEEETIRSIGFYGSDAPMEKLLWFMIYQCCSLLSEAAISEEKLTMPPFPTRPDGGRYFPMGFYLPQNPSQEKVPCAGFSYNGAMHSQQFQWFGLYNFGQSEVQNLVLCITAEARKLRELLCEVLDNGFSPESAYTGAMAAHTNPDEEKAYQLSLLVQKGYLRVEEGKLYPNFCVFDRKQYRQLEEKVFAPVVRKVKEEYSLVIRELRDFYRGTLPKQLENLQDFAVIMACRDVSYLTTLFAFRDQKLYVPADCHDGEFLTLTYIKN